MTTNELKEALRELDKLSLRVHNSFDGGSLYIKFKTNVIAEIDNHTERSLDTYYKGFKTLDEALQKELFPLIIDYATTPIEEREESEKYYWKMKFDNYINGKYLNVRFDNKWLVADARGNDRFKTMFTEEEYKKMVEDNFIPDIFEKEEII